MLKGAKMSAESRLKISIARKGKPSNFKGKVLSLESKKKMSDARKAYLMTLDPNYAYVLDTSTRKGNKRVRRERMRNQGGKHTKQEWENLKKIFNNSCAKCLRTEAEVKLTKDHIVAVSSGGTDDIRNLQPLCNSCNARKYISPIRY